MNCIHLARHKGPIAGSCENGNTNSCSIKGGEFLE